MIRRSYLRRQQQELGKRVKASTTSRSGPHLVWVQRLSEKGNYWGFGDTLRGTLSYIQACMKLSVDIKITMSKHPISQFFTMESPYTVDCSGDNIIFVGKDGGGFLIDSFKTNRSIYTNCFPDHSITNYEREILKTILTIKPEYKITIPVKPYTILHVRFDDKYLTSPLPSSVLESILSLTKPYIQENTILCCNLDIFKKHCKGSDYSESSYQSTHSGLAHSKEELLETIRDFQLLMHASTIYTYSEYPWISGFVHWVSEIYKVPLVDLRTESMIAKLDR